MVGQDSGLPDPPDSDDSLTTNTEIVMMNDSDSDDDINEYNGYEPLPFELVDNEPVISDEEIEEQFEEPPISLPPLSLAQEVWANTVTNPVDIVMDKEREDEVKQVMLNITLPPSSIPEWASSVPEDEWKNHLMQRLNIVRKND